MTTTTTLSSSGCIFSIHVPVGESNGKYGSSIDKDTSAATNEKEQFQLFQLCHSPKQPKEDDQQQQEKIDQKDSNDNDDEQQGDDERESQSLLLSTTTPATTTTLANRMTGWRFQSPMGVLESSILLKLTYRLGWKSIPEYTSCKKSSSSYFSSSSSKVVCKSGCCCCSNSDNGFHSVTFTTKDIVKMQHIKAMSIPGLPFACQAVKLYLRFSLSELLDHDDDVMPAHILIPFQQYVRHCVPLSEYKNNATQQQQQQSKQQPTTKKDESDDDNNCLILTFAMPLQTHHDHDPPLLWRVELPTPPKTAEEFDIISLETTTILDGTLAFAKKDITPSHIYINGYQSWSFAGSIVKGEPQPKPALPDHYSRAFNYGGSPPPYSSNAVACNNNGKDDSNNQDDQDNDTSHEYQPVRGSRGNNNNNKKSWFSSMYSSSKSNKTDSSSSGKDNDNWYQSDFYTCISTLSDNNSDTLGNNNAETKEKSTSSYFGNKKATTPIMLDEMGGPAFVLGWVSQLDQYGVITADAQLEHLQMHASQHGQLYVHNPIQTDWAYTQFAAPQKDYQEEPMMPYLHTVAAYNRARPIQNGPLLTGWCSWYHYYEKISEKSLRENFSRLAEMSHPGSTTGFSTNVALVDDGYMTAWGDWDSLKPTEFSNLKRVSEDISANGMRPGLWMAPFACDKHSKLAKEHPDWIIRNEHGKPSNSSNCGKFFYGLDATNPEVLEYVYKCIQKVVQEYGFSVLKLDFLYAACLEGNGKYNLSISRAQAMHLGLQTIRAAAGPNVFIIGCGCPLASAVGYIDGMRVSADTGPTWKPAFPLPYWDHGTLPSLRGMIRNSMSRAPIGHRWWQNDPDCLLLGKSTSLSNDQVMSAASIIALTCGMMLISDDLQKVHKSRLQILTKIFPMTGITAIVLDLHNTTRANKGMPCLLRLWCTDENTMIDTYRENVQNSVRNLELLDEEDNDNDNNDFFNSSSNTKRSNRSEREHLKNNAEATFFARKSSFCPDDENPPHPKDGQRNCIHVAKGLGTWTILSMSNWSDKSAVLEVPIPLALQNDTKNSGSSTTMNGRRHGYHVFAFWSSKYIWMAEEEDENKNATTTTNRSSCCYLSKLLAPHATEIFHIKPVQPDIPQYIGSDFHFSCGQEVLSFQWWVHPSSPSSSDSSSNNNKDTVEIYLRNDYYRVGSIFVYLPTIHTRQICATCGGTAQEEYKDDNDDTNEKTTTTTNNDAPASWTAVGNTPRVSETNGPSSNVAGRILQINVTIHGNGSANDGKVTILY